MVHQLLYFSVGFMAIRLMLARHLSGLFFVPSCPLRNVHLCRCCSRAPSRFARAPVAPSHVPAVPCPPPSFFSFSRLDSLRLLFYAIFFPCLLPSAVLVLRAGWCRRPAAPPARLFAASSCGGGWDGACVHSLCIFHFSFFPRYYSLDSGPGPGSLPARSQQASSQLLPAGRAGQLLAATLLAPSVVCGTEERRSGRWPAEGGTDRNCCAQGCHKPHRKPG